MDSIRRGNAACLKCNYDPINVVREAMFEVEQGEAPKSRIANRIGVLKQQKIDDPELYDALAAMDLKNNVIAAER